MNQLNTLVQNENCYHTVASCRSELLLCYSKRGPQTKASLQTAFIIPQKDIKTSIKSDSTHLAAFLATWHCCNNQMCGFMFCLRTNRDELKTELKKVLHVVSLSSTALKNSGDRKFCHQGEVHQLCRRKKWFEVRNSWVVALTALLTDQGPIRNSNG